MSSAIKVKAPEVKSLKRGGGVTGAGGGSNGSLKENRVAGVKTEAAATRAGRVLRSRK